MKMIKETVEAAQSLNTLCRVRSALGKSMADTGWAGAEEFVESCSDDELIDLLDQFVRSYARVNAPTMTEVEQAPLPTSSVTRLVCASSLSEERPTMPVPPMTSAELVYGNA
jgi:hypothetical protein